MSDAFEALAIGQIVIDDAKQREGFYARVYNDRSDGKGTQTIGYGTVDPEYAKPGVVLTEPEATVLLVKELTRKADDIKEWFRKCGHPCPSQALWDVMLDFSYNCGEGALETSTWLKLHHEGKCFGAASADVGTLMKIGEGTFLPTNAADAICMYSKQNHEFVLGLLHRRMMNRSDYLMAVNGPYSYIVEPAGVEMPKPRVAQAIPAPAHPAVAVGGPVGVALVTSAVVAANVPNATWVFPVAVAVLGVVAVVAVIIVIKNRSK